MLLEARVPIFIVISLIAFIRLFKIDTMTRIFRDIQFPYLNEEIVKEYCSKNNDKKLSQLINVVSLTDDQIAELWNFNTLKTQHDIFITGILILLSTLGVLIPQLKEYINIFSQVAVFGFVTIIILLFRFSTMATSTNAKARKGSLTYAFIVSIGLYIYLKFLPLDALDIREYIKSFWDVPERVLNISLCIFVFLVAYVLAYPAVQYFAAFRVCTTIDKEVGKWRHCFETYKQFMSTIQNSMTTIYIAMPVPTAVLFFVRRFVLKYEVEFYIEVAYVVIEFIMSIQIFYHVKLQLKMMINDKCRLLTTFEENKLEKSGINFYKEIGQALQLLPTTAISLYTYPMLVITCCAAFGISFLLTGIYQEILRFNTILLLAVMEVVMGMNKFACVLIE